MVTKHGHDLKDFESVHNPSQEIRYLRERVSELERQREQERRLTGEHRVLTMALTDAIEKSKPVKMEYKPRPSEKKPVTMVLHLTDLHYGEVIKANEVEGFNEFNPDIAKKRLQSLGSKLIRKLENQRAGYNVPYLHILGTADYISGDIHQELQVTNAFPCPVQAVECGYALGSLVMMLAPHFEKVSLDLITMDNHGRMTQRNQMSEGGLNNWGYVVAQVVKQHISSQKNVVANVHARASAVVEIGTERYLLLHGHQIKGWAGLPYYGFDRRVAMEAVKRMNVADTSFTRLVMGHFHVSVDSANWMIGGSLSGTNAYDHSCGRHSPAHQTSWFVHPTHGQFDFTRWFL